MRVHRQQFTELTHGVKERPLSTSFKVSRGSQIPQTTVMCLLKRLVSTDIRGSCPKAKVPIHVGIGHPFGALCSLINGAKH